MNAGCMSEETLEETIGMDGENGDAIGFEKFNFRF